MELNKFFKAVGWNHDSAGGSPNLPTQTFCDEGNNCCSRLHNFYYCNKKIQK